MIGATQIVRRPLIVADAGSCPFALVDPDAEPLVEPDCGRFVADSVNFLVQQPPTTIVVGTAPSYFDGERSRELEDAMVRAVDALRSAGHEVTLVGPVPQFPNWWPWGCTLVEALSDTTGCGESKPAAVATAELMRSTTALRSIAESSEAYFLPIEEVVCLTNTCATNDGTRWIYRDGLHISIGQSSQLAPLLATTIRSSSA
jgi:hypothetical protein